jgi:hypothetical protein
MNPHHFTCKKTHVLFEKVKYNQERGKMEGREREGMGEDGERREEAGRDEWRETGRGRKKKVVEFTKRSKN